MTRVDNGSHDPYSHPVGIPLVPIGHNPDAFMLSLKYPELETPSVQLVVEKEEENDVAEQEIYDKLLQFLNMYAYAIDGTEVAGKYGDLVKLAHPENMLL